jgi:preprotein translocase subunit SecD
VVDGKLIIAPRIEAEVSEGIAQISGRMTTAQAAELAAKINAGVNR